MTIAVVFVPAAHVELYASQCLAYCAARGYEVAGVVTGRWSAVLDMLATKAASVVVVARADHLNPHREPRLEIVGEAPQAAGPHDNSRPASLRKRRAHRI